MDEILTDYTAKVNKKRRSKKMLAESCELVCVHIRRGDHLEYEKLNGAEPLKKQYFLQAMDVYKENLKHPVFIIVTDDPQWAHTQIHKSFKPYFTGEISPSLRVLTISFLQASTTRPSKTLLVWTWRYCPPAITWSCHAEHLGCGATFSQDLLGCFPSISWQKQLASLWS